MTHDIDTRFRNLEAKIGMFVVLALIGCLVTVAFISFEDDFFTTRYRLHFTASKGTGFTRGMPVKLSGFRIGRVEAIELNPEARVDVTMQIDTRYQQWIRKDSLTRLSKEGFVGDTVVEVSTGSLSAPLLQDGDRIGHEQTVTIEEHAAEIAGRIKPILIEVRDMLGYVNNPEGEIKRSLGHIEQLTRDLQQTRDRTDRLLERSTASIEGIAADINKLAGHADRTFGNVDTSLTRLDKILDQVDRQLPQTLARLETTLANTERITADLRQATTTAAPRIPPLLEQADHVVRDTGKLVNKIQGHWLLGSEGEADQPVPPAAPDNRHE